MRKFEADQMLKQRVFYKKKLPAIMGECILLDEALESMASETTTQRAHLTGSAE